MKAEAMGGGSPQEGTAPPEQEARGGLPVRFEPYMSPFDRLSSPCMMYSAKRRILSAHGSSPHKTNGPSKSAAPAVHPTYDLTTGRIVAYEGLYAYPKKLGTFTGQFSASTCLTEGMGTFKFQDGTEVHAAEWGRKCSNSNGCGRGNDLDAYGGLPG